MILTKESTEKGATMNEKDFNELLKSVEEMNAIERGELKPARVTRRGKLPAKETELAKLRESTGMTQKEFAKALETSLNTYRNWEQGRQPTPGVAKVAARLLSGSAA